MRTGISILIDQVLATYGLRRDRAADGSIMHMTAAFLLGPDGHQVRQYNGLEVSAQTVVRDIDRAAGAG
ncbi:MAG: hypothetical protein ACLQAT_04160 [Candidatus Binataceae bacterium]